MGEGLSLLQAHSLCLLSAAVFDMFLWLERGKSIGSAKRVSRDYIFDNFKTSKTLHLDLGAQRANITHDEFTT